MFAICNKLKELVDVDNNFDRFHPLMINTTLSIAYFFSTLHNI